MGPQVLHALHSTVYEPAAVARGSLVHTTTSTPTSRLRACAGCRAQFEEVLGAYKAKSKWWNPTLNKFAEGTSLATSLP